MILVGLLATLTAFAQPGLNTMSGHVAAFGDNPGANTGIGYFVAMPNMMVNAELSQTIPSLWGDVAHNISLMDAHSLDLHGQMDLDAFGAGITVGKHKFWITSQTQLDLHAQLDKDLLVFVQRGMLDDQGNIDPNYTGDFSFNQFGLYLGSHLNLGWQAQLSSKLRLGIAHRRSTTVFAARAKTNAFTFNSTDLGNNINAVNVNLDADLGYYSSAYALNPDSSMQGMLSDFRSWLGDHSRVREDMSNAFNQSSWDFGLTYDLNSEWSVTASYLGLGPTVDLKNSGLGYQVQADLDYDGFDYDLSDSATHPQFYFADLQQYVGDSVFADGVSPSWLISPYRGSHVGLVWQPALSHTVSVDFWERVRRFQRTQTVGVNYQFQPTRGLQCAVGYRQPINYSDGRMPSLSVRMQFRVLPWVFVNMSMANVSMVAYPTDWSDYNQPWMASHHLNRANISAGVTMMIWDKSTREAYRNRSANGKSDKAARREAKKASRKL